MKRRLENVYCTSSENTSVFSILAALSEERKTFMWAEVL